MKPFFQTIRLSSGRLARVPRCVLESVLRGDSPEVATQSKPGRIMSLSEVAEYGGGRLSPAQIRGEITAENKRAAMGDSILAHAEPGNPLGGEDPHDRLSAETQIKDGFRTAIIAAVDAQNLTIDQKVKRVEQLLREREADEVILRNGPKVKAAKPTQESFASRLVGRGEVARRRQLLEAKGGAR